MLDYMHGIDCELRRINRNTPTDVLIEVGLFAACDVPSISRYFSQLGAVTVDQRRDFMEKMVAANYKEMLARVVSEHGAQHRLDLPVAFSADWTPPQRQSAAEAPQSAAQAPQPPQRAGQAPQDAAEAPPAQAALVPDAPEAEKIVRSKPVSAIVIGGYRATGETSTGDTVGEEYAAVKSWKAGDDRKIRAQSGLLRRTVALIRDVARSLLSKPTPVPEPDQEPEPDWSPPSSSGPGF